MENKKITNNNKCIFFSLHLTLPRSCHHLFNVARPLSRLFSTQERILFDLTLNLVTTRLWNTGRHVSVVVTVNYDSLKADTKMESQGRTAWQSWAS